VPSLFSAVIFGVFFSPLLCWNFRPNPCSVFNALDGNMLLWNNSMKIGNNSRGAATPFARTAAFDRADLAGHEKERCRILVKAGRAGTCSGVIQF